VSAFGGIVLSILLAIWMTGCLLCIAVPIVDPKARAGMWGWPWLVPVWPLPVLWDTVVMLRRRAEAKRGRACD